MMIFSIVAMTGLEKCYITSAYLQWLCHSGERPVARGPLVFGMIIDIGPKFYSALSPPYDLEVKVTDLVILSLSFTSKFLRSCIFLASFPTL